VKSQIAPKIKICSKQIKICEVQEINVWKSIVRTSYLTRTLYADRQQLENYETSCRIDDRKKEKSEAEVVKYFGFEYGFDLTFTVFNITGSLMCFVSRLVQTRRISIF